MSGHACRQGKVRDHYRVSEIDPIFRHDYTCEMIVNIRVIILAVQRKMWRTKQAGAGSIAAIAHSR